MQNEGELSQPNMPYWAISLRGALMGAADVIPGVSGGTIALIVGIYPKFIHALSQLNLEVPKAFLAFLRAKDRKQAKADLVRFLGERDIFFLAALGVGIVLSFLSLARIIPYLLEKHPAEMNGFFFGLILASVWMPYQMMEKRGVKELIAFSVTALSAYWFTGLGALNLPGNMVFLFASGGLAVSAMLLPGVSGSFLLLILGQYKFMLSAVRDLNLPIIAVFVAGMGTGLLLFSRLLRWLFLTYPSTTLAALAGLMIGSLRKIWPYKIELSNPVTIAGKTLHATRNIWPGDELYTGPALSPFALFALGLFAVFALNRIANKQR